MGHLGHVWDVPRLPGTLGDSGIGALNSGMLGTCLGSPQASQDSGMKSGIGSLHSGTLRTRPGCPRASQDSGMGWTVGLEPSTVGHSGHVRASWSSGMGWTVGLEPSTVGHVRHIPGLPGTLGWVGQWDCSHLEWDAWLGLWDGMDSGIEAI